VRKNLCTFGSRLELAQERPEELVATLPPASAVVEGGCGEPAPSGGARVVVGRESCRELRQLRSLIRCAATCDDCRGCFQVDRNIVVGRRGRSGEVTCSLLRVTHSPGEPSMHRPLRLYFRAGKDSRRKQWMSELEAFPCHLDDVCGDGRRKRDIASLTADCMKQRHRRRSGSGHDGEHLDRVGPEVADASVGDLL
jgi:hypothetical protein